MYGRQSFRIVHSGTKLVLTALVEIHQAGCPVANNENIPVGILSHILHFENRHGVQRPFVPNHRIELQPHQDMERRSG